MRRLWVVVALCLSMTCAVASASARTGSSVGSGLHHAKRAVKLRRRTRVAAHRSRGAKKAVKSTTVTATTAAVTAAGSDPVLVGDTNVESVADNDSAGQAEAFQFTASASGSTTTGNFYASGFSPSKAYLALYSNASAGKPGSLLASGSVSNPTSGWNSFTFSGTSVTAGTKYWLAILGVGGTIGFRDKSSGNSYCTSATNLTSPPASFPSSVACGSGSISAYVSGTGTAPPPPPPPPPAPPAAPTAAFTFSPSSPVTGQQVVFNASGSTCNATPCTYSWKDVTSSGTDDWSLGTGNPLDFTFQVAATKYVTLTVTDALGQTGSVEHNVTVVSSSSSTTPTTTTTASSSSTSTTTTSSSSSTTTTSTTSSSSTSSVDPPPVPPSNTGLPVISGTAQAGDTLTASDGTWQGDTPMTYSYAWEQCDSSGNNCTTVSAASGNTYPLDSGDVGRTIRGVATATNDAGSASATSLPTVVVTATSSSTCNFNSTPSSFASDVSAATTGQTVCLASGNYGTWTGTNKAITVEAASGASPQMQIDFASGASGFTLSGMTNMSGIIDGPANNLTVENSTFTGSLLVSWDTGIGMSNVVINHNSFDWNAYSANTPYNAKIALNEVATPTTGTLSKPSIIVENNDIENGDLDGIHVGGGAGMIIRNNYFNNLCDRNINHTDNIQFEGGSQTNVEGNYIYTPGPEPSTGCVAGGIDSYDGETNGVIIEDNVVDVTRDWGIELYSDNGSIVRHNTVVYHPNSYSAFNSGDGQIDIDRKSQDPAGTGTHVYDNVGTAEFNNGSTGTANNNTDPSTVTYVSPCAKGCTYGAPVVHDNYLLAPGSAGVGVADNGSNTGIFAASW